MYENEPSNPKDDQFISWIKVSMICAGLWSGPVGTHRIVKKLYNGYSKFMRYSFFILAFLLCLELLRLIIEGYDMHTVIGSLGVVISVVKIVAKVVVFMRYPLLEVFTEIVRKEREVWAFSCKEIQTLYRTKVKFIRSTVLALFLSSSVTVVTLQVSGALATLKIQRYNTINNASLESHFMYQTILPLNRINHIKWLFLSEILWGWIGLMYSSVTQLIYITILMYAVVQLQILQIGFRNFMGSKTELFPTHAEALEGARKLREHMMTHKTIIRFIDHFNQKTKHITMVDFIFYSLDIASVSLCLSKMEILKSGWYLFYFLTLFLQLVLTVWSCNEIKVQSEELGNALFHSRWYLLDQQTQQNVLFMMKRIKKPLYMTIGVFGPMTTSSILLVLKAAYSYVNLIKK